MAPISSELCAELERLNLGFVTNAVELVIESTWSKKYERASYRMQS